MLALYTNNPINVDNRLNFNKYDILNFLQINESDLILINNCLVIANNAIITPKKLTDKPSIDEIFNIIPEVKKNEKYKFIFSWLYAENSRLNGNILMEKMFLKFCFEYLKNNYGAYHFMLFPIALNLSKCVRELGLIDESYEYLNLALKIAIFYNDFSSIEILECLENFILFSKHVNETNEEGVYSEIMGKIITKNIKNLNKKFEKIKYEKENYDNIKINKNEEFIVNKNTEFKKFQFYSLENKIECIIQLNYFMKHIDYLTTFGKVGKNTESILKKFNQCENILENMRLLNDKKINFTEIFLEHENINPTNEKIFKEFNLFFFYFNPKLMLFLTNSKISKIKDSKQENNSIAVKNFDFLQKLFCDIIFHRYHILKFISPENKHKHLIEAYNLIESNNKIIYCKEKLEYHLEILKSIIQVFCKAEDEANSSKYIKKYVELLNIYCKKDQILYNNKILALIKIIIKSSSGKMDKYVYDYLNSIETFYSGFFELTPEILEKKINEVNYIFSDFYYCAAHLVKAYKLEDSFLCMDLANKIYYNKLGRLSENFKESNNFLNKLDEKARLENYNE